MKPTVNAIPRILVLVLLIVPLLFACNKDVKRKKFDLRTKTWYRLSPTDPVPVTIGGVNYVGFAYFPGGGSGTATHMGNVSYYFNQLTYSAGPSGPPAGSVSAPLIDVLTYPVTGGPLPLIQEGDFAGLSALQSTLGIPAETYGLVINAVIVDKNNNEVFTSAISGSGSTFPISATRIGFNGKALITGGRGKFKNAVGEIDYEGSFNVNDANDAEYNAEGWISY